MKGDFTKAKEITAETKIKVLLRQNQKSISGATLVGKSTIEFHHYVPRSASGVGYEWNIVALTSEEHRSLHDKQNIKVNGRDRYTWEEFETIIHNHLLLNYLGWRKEKCKYHKYWEEKDYEVRRRDKEQ